MVDWCNHLHEKQQTENCLETASAVHNTWPCETSAEGGGRTLLEGFRERDRLILGRVQAGPVV